MFDYSNAPDQRSDELIPAGTIATLQLHIRPGNASEGGLLTRSRDGACEMLDCEFTVVEGPHMKRKLWERMVLSGTTAGHEMAVGISRGKLRAMLESGRNIKPDDMSEQARTRGANYGSATSSAAQPPARRRPSKFPERNCAPSSKAPAGSSPTT